ncbi:2-C-methyl-D-erythritol 4-phosphate cytidylyltransferase [Verrucomicrobia bacterium]|nr:2-C-methyl-D-erythritol 4-phosphate cytidylyltransferase [Verrucomicrobiota bacterium]
MLAPAAMNVAVIVAAGKGTRMGQDKLWLELQGVPVVGHTWQLFDRLSMVDRVVLVTRDPRREDLCSLGSTLQLTKPFDLVSGGSTRQDSVWNGLEACGHGCELVAIHDAARPCTHPEHIQACFAAAAEHGAVVAAERITDTLKRVDALDRIEDTVDREGLWSVQTPQVFRFALIRKALKEVRIKGLRVTDDAAACELLGFPVKVVPGRHPNPKVTYPSDLPYIRWLLANLSTEV